jgi:hypothetical protein
MSRERAPSVLITLDGYRLVHEVRDQTAWPHISDPVLEQLGTDAMGEPRWIYITSWCLGPVTESGLKERAEEVALRMLVNPGPVLKTKSDR